MDRLTSPTRDFNVAEVISHWNELLFARLPSSQKLPLAVLNTTSQLFLEELMRILTSGETPSLFHLRPICESHAKSRASETLYSFDDLMIEFELFHKAVLQKIQDGRLPIEVDLVLTFFSLIQRETCRWFLELTKNREAPSLLEPQLLAHQMRMVVDELPLLVSYVDRNEVYDFCNRIYGPWLNRPINEIVGHSLREVLGEVNYTRFKPRFDRVLSGETVTYEDQIIISSETKFFVANYIPDFSKEGKVLGFLVIIHDITERKQAELALEHLAEAGRRLSVSLDFNETLGSITDFVTNGFADWCAIDLEDSRGTLSRVALVHSLREKQALSREYNVFLDSFPGEWNSPHSSPFAFRTWTPEFLKNVGDEQIRAAAINDAHINYMKAMGLKSSISVPLMARNRVFGAITFVLGDSGRIYSDTDFLWAQQFAQRAALALDNANLYKQAIDQAKQLEDEKAVRERFVNSVAHDLRNPLGTAMVSAEVLEGWAKENEINRKSQARIIKSLRRADKLVQNLLDANRLRAGESLHLDIEKCDLFEIGQTALEDLGSVYDHEFNFVGSSSPGYWSREGLTRVIENLVINGIKYGEPSRPITLTVVSHDSETFLSVQNEGTPLSPAERETLFDLFQRSHFEERGNRRGGWGVGLAVVKGIVEAHGGKVTVDSSLKTGTVFSVKLPTDSRLHYRALASRSRPL